ncbi:anti-virulence regulator CigR family protein [Halomonas saccharevitans]|uniref:Anti-virulence regulator CigR family protein n=1 Tax=Halomonas saccharevitans TaxID=416872 RepID=A0ABU3N9U8_9GAMM|nr:anti-virulence regulator CigR family protein [Halomonas saccharevitans]MDT8877981.1 anti-virulence regulator CigR family protein [Halomonas saccharevitans]
MRYAGCGSLLAFVTALGLALVAAPLLAQPGNGQGVGKGGVQQRGQGQETVQGRQGRSQHGQDQRGQGRSDERYRQARRDDDRYRDRGRDREQDRDRDVREARRLRIDEREIRDIFHRRRDALDLDERDRLPPGIRKNLARGKPLPPGIAKNFDPRLRRELPYYEGYEWRRVGADAVLVDITNDIIREVIHDILR